MATNSRDYMREYRNRNREKKRESDRKYYEAHKEEVKKRATEWNRKKRAEDPEYRERCRELTRKWRDRNREKLHKQAKKRREENGDAIRAKEREWYARRKEELSAKKAKAIREDRAVNPEKYRVRAKNYRDKKNGAVNTRGRKYHREVGKVKYGLNFPDADGRKVNKNEISIQCAYSSYKSTKTWSNTGYKNISQTKSGSFEAAIVIKGKRYSKKFKTINEALKYREVLYEMRDKYLASIEEKYN